MIITFFAAAYFSRDWDTATSFSNVCQCTSRVWMSSRVALSRRRHHLLAWHKRTSDRVRWADPLMWIWFAFYIHRRLLQRSAWSGKHIAERREENAKRVACFISMSMWESLCVKAKSNKNIHKILKFNKTPLHVKSSFLLVFSTHKIYLL